MKKIIILLVLFSGFNASAQNLEKIKMNMLKLAPMVGNWQGSGWIQQQDRRIEFDQKEEINMKLDGTALLIEGSGFENDSLMFQAMAVASFNEVTGKYRFNSFLADGKTTEAEGWFDEEGIFHWQFEVPNGGTVKYTIEFNDTTWTEKGEFSPPNVEQWFPFMAMNLKKIK